MKRFLIVLLILITFGLCALCVVQWQREDRYRGHIVDLVKRLEAENAAKVEALRKVREYEKEIARLTELRAEVEAKLVEITRDYNDLTHDSVARGITIAIYMREYLQMSAGYNAAQIALGRGGDAVKERNATVTAQNSTIEKQNQLLRRVAAERDAAIDRLNARTRELNELVGKYNKLAKER